MIKGEKVVEKVESMVDFFLDGDGRPLLWFWGKMDDLIDNEGIN